MLECSYIQGQIINEFGMYFVEKVFHIRTYNQPKRDHKECCSNCYYHYVCNIFYSTEYLYTKVTLYRDTA